MGVTTEVLFIGVVTFIAVFARGFANYGLNKPRIIIWRAVAEQVRNWFMVDATISA